MRRTWTSKRRFYFLAKIPRAQRHSMHTTWIFSLDRGKFGILLIGLDHRWLRYFNGGSSNANPQRTGGGVFFECFSLHRIRNIERGNVWTENVLFHNTIRRKIMHATASIEYKAFDKLQYVRLQHRYTRILT